MSCSNCVDPVEAAGLTKSTLSRCRSPRFLGKADQSVVGGKASKPITGQTTYTLSSIDAGGATLTKTATVNILPSFQEL